MIIDNIKNAPLYYGVSERIAVALKFLRENDFSVMNPGKYEIDGSNVYALVQRYESKPVEKCKWEAHRRYIDVQYVAEGIEQIGYANLGQMKVSQEYREEGDYLLLEGKGDFFIFRDGNFAIFAPQDVHMPCIAAAEPQIIKKVVVKILV